MKFFKRKKEKDIKNTPDLIDVFFEDRWTETEDINLAIAEFKRLEDLLLEVMKRPPGYATAYDENMVHRSIRSVKNWLRRHGINPEDLD